jgi:hypothetical protein
MYRSRGATRKEEEFFYSPCGARIEMTSHIQHLYKYVASQNEIIASLDHHGGCSNWASAYMVHWDLGR